MHVDTPLCIYMSCLAGKEASYKGVGAGVGGHCWNVIGARVIMHLDAPMCYMGRPGLKWRILQGGGALLAWGV